LFLFGKSVGAYLGDPDAKGNATGWRNQILATVLTHGMCMNDRLLTSHTRRNVLATVASAIALTACQANGDGSTNLAEASTVGPLQCQMQLPSGPPAKPDRMSALGTAAAWNVGRTVGRNAIASAGTFVAGPVGGAVAGNIAARALPSEFDIRGRWTITDGQPDCACSVTVSGEGSWSGANTPRGRIVSSGCNNALLASANDFRLDESMTGIDAELLIYAQNGNRIAVLNRDGPDYYSGRLSNGQSIMLWRD
jgi:hypothetical protein